MCFAHTSESDALKCITGSLSPTYALASQQPVSLASVLADCVGLCQRRKYISSPAGPGSWSEHLLKRHMMMQMLRLGSGR